MEDQFRIRLAHTGDAGQLAKVHWITSSVQPGGFMYRLGKPFLVQYYNVFLQEKNGVILCAEQGNSIVGIVSGSFDAQEHSTALRKHRLRLFLGALPALLRHPRLIRGMLFRQGSLSVGSHERRYIILNGVRLEYWGWLPDHKSVMGAVTLLQNWLKLMHLLGARRIIHEVDKDNKKSFEIHCLLGSKVVEEFITGDGNSRLIMEYQFEEEYQ